MVGKAVFVAGTSDEEIETARYGKIREASSARGKAGV
jgi:hypothetical protein